MGRVHANINSHIDTAAVVNGNVTAPAEGFVKPDSKLIRRLLTEEKDERYRYLLRHGTVQHIEPETFSLFVELPQIPNIVIVYRRPVEREESAEKIAIENKGLNHIPLLEGEERMKYLNLQGNKIKRIENLVSIP
jgi:leucine-rich repeat-containing protein 49